jgi:hypothetical protein
MKNVMKNYYQDLFTNNRNAINFAMRDIFILSRSLSLSFSFSVLSQMFFQLKVKFALFLFSAAVVDVCLNAHGK